MTHDKGRFVWHELVTTDVEAARPYYEEVIGWKVQPMAMPGGVEYPLLMVGEQPVGGLAAPKHEGAAPSWVGYISVDDVDAAAKAVVANGGSAKGEAFDVPTVGRMQPVEDPNGAPFFLFCSESGDTPAATGAGSFHWNELTADDPERAVAFYEKVFGYTHETMEMPTGAYFVLKSGDSPRAGVMKTPAPGLAAQWTQYVTVDDCDAAVARATKRGGRVAVEAMNVPGVGRFAVVADPRGATLGVITPEG